MPSVRRNRPEGKKLDALNALDPATDRVALNEDERGIFLRARNASGKTLKNRAGRMKNACRICRKRGFLGAVANPSPDLWTGVIAPALLVDMLTNQ